MSCSGELLSMRRGSWEPSVYSFWSEARWSGTCTWHLKWGQSCGTKPVSLWDMMPTPGGECWDWGEVEGTKLVSGELVGVKEEPSQLVSEVLWVKIASNVKQLAFHLKILHNEEKNLIYLISQKLSQPKKLVKSFHFQSLHGSERKNTDSWLSPSNIASGIIT